MHTIAFLTPSEAIGERVLRLTEELKPYKLDVYDGSADMALESAACAIEAGGLEVIVARGSAALAVSRAYPDIPVIPIPVSGQDLVRALDEAKKVTGLERPRIGLMAFPFILADTEYLAGLLNIDLHIYKLFGNDSYEAILKAKKDGIELVIAGNTTSALARQHGLLTVFLESGDVSLNMALQEAYRVGQVRVLERAAVQKFRTILDVSRDGVLILDTQGQIEMANQAAMNILQLITSPVGLDAKSIFPKETVDLVVKEGNPVLDEVVTFAGRALLVNLTPLWVEGTIVGAVATLQKVEAISALETKIRKSLLAKGMVNQYTFASIRSTSPQMTRVVSQARKYAATNNAVLIMGETGTGKELFAQAIHAASPQSHGPFVAVNCAALPPTLLESELFGYEEGAFTGARRQGKPGLFELANGGTIFLDEISEMDHYGQTRLLRILQERSSLRLGGDKYTAVTARVIAASNRDLYAHMLAGKFREDLLYRLNTLTLAVPPLREREGDVVYLAKLFVEERMPWGGKALQFTPAMQNRLRAHHWRGNIRELRAVIERLILWTENGQITMDMLEESLKPTPDFTGHSPLAEAIPTIPPAVFQARDSVDERNDILRALKATGGNQVQAAVLLGIHRGTLYRKMRRYDIRRTIA